MESSCVRQTLIPGTSKLFGDFLYDFEKVRQFYSYNFQDPAAFDQAALQIQYPDDRRAALVSALREQNPDSPLLDRLAKPGTMAVVTGQQVGLFSGPAYTIYKALTAVKLAEHLTASGIPAVPVFWLATEDHDLAEVAYNWVFNSEGVPAKVSFFPPSTAGGPVGNVKLKQFPIGELRAKLAGLPYAEEVVKSVETAYQPGMSLGEAFRTLLTELLSGIEILYLDPLAQAVREVASPFLCHAVKAVPDLLSKLRQRNRELSEAGYHSQVNIEEDTSLVFLLEDRRLPLRWKDGRFHSRDRSYDANELANRASAISPNALLRPVMQDFLLPTVAYVGGPAEIAYMAQAEVLYKSLLGRMPVIYPRNSFTVLDLRATKILNRYDMRVTDLLEHHDEVRTRMARKLVPADLLDKFSSLRASVQSSMVQAENSLRSFDPTLEAAGKKSAAKIRYQIDKLIGKTARETMRRDGRAIRDATYVLNLVYPERHLQERFFSILPFLAKAGPDLPAALLGQTQLSCPDHMVRTF